MCFVLVLKIGKEFINAIHLMRQGVIGNKKKIKMMLVMVTLLNTVCCYAPMCKTGNCLHKACMFHFFCATLYTVFQKIHLIVCTIILFWS